MLPRISRAKRDYVGDTTSNRSEDPPWIGGTGKTSNPIFYQHKITSTIFAQKPISERRRRLRHWHRRNRGGRDMVTNPQASNLGLKVLNYDKSHRTSASPPWAKQFQSNSPIFAWVRSRPRYPAGAGKNQDLRGGRPGFGAQKIAWE